MKKQIIPFLVLCLMVFSCTKPDGGNGGGGSGGGTNPTTIKMPAKEIRAVWIATIARIDWPANYTVETQKKQYTDYLDKFLQYNVNAVIVQIRPTADAFYPSTLEPWSQWITGTQGKNPGYDVLQFMIDEAHKRGLEFHAWLNPYRLSNSASTFDNVAAPNHIYKTHPEYTMRYGNLLMFRPALPEVRKLLFDVVDDLITRYDIDGLHFDDYFYPYPDGVSTIDDDADFIKYGAGFSNKGDFRRHNVNLAIEGLHNIIKTKRPDMLFGIAPFGTWRHSSKDPNGSQTSGLANYDDLYADVRLWCEKGWIDYVAPQLYNSTSNAAQNYIKQSEWWPKNSFNVPVIVGQALYRYGVTAEGAPYQTTIEMETQFFYARRQPKIVGTFQYNASAFTTNRINILETLDKMYKEKALIPFMGRATEPVPTKPTGVKVDGANLTWTAQGAKERAAVYFVENNVASLLGVTKTNTFSVSKSGKYLVSFVNTDNKEGEYAQVTK